MIKDEKATKEKHQRREKLQKEPELLHVKEKKKGLKRKHVDCKRNRKLLTNIKHTKEQCKTQTKLTKESWKKKK